MWLADSVIWGPPETSRAHGLAKRTMTSCNSRGRSRGRKCPPFSIVAVCTPASRVRSCWRSLALAQSLSPPDEAHWHLDISVDGGRRLPASGIAQQADGRPVVTAPIANLVHFLEQLWGDISRIRHTALQ